MHIYKYTLFSIAKKKIDLKISPLQQLYTKNKHIIFE